MKPVVFYIRSAIISLMCFFGIAMFFFNSTMFDNFVAKGLHLKLNPSLIGGEIANEYFYDEDLVQYTIHKPVSEAKWQRYSEYWQLDMVFKKPLSPQDKVLVYIDIDGDSKGSIEPLDGDFLGDLGLLDGDVQFDPAHPWDYCAAVSADGSKVYGAYGAAVSDIQTNFLDGRKKLVIRIPLQDKGLQKAYLNKSAFHYISAPKTFVAQAVDMNAGGSISKEQMEELIKVAKALAPSFDSDTEPQFSSTDQKISHYKKLCEQKPDDLVSLAKLGSAIATKGGESNVAQAVKLVNQAFVYLDKAAELAQDTPQEFDVLMERAHVCAAVPEMVFAKSQIGARDFERCAELCPKQNKELAAYLYAMAAECYNNCDKTDRAKRACAQAQKCMARAD